MNNCIQYNIFYITEYFILLYLVGFHTLNSRSFANLKNVVHDSQNNNVNILD